MNVAPADSARERFVSRVESAFDKAGIQYVCIHAYGPDVVSDSDVDVAVSRDDLSLADSLIRSGKLGRVVQCVHYDVPWCRWYVLRSDEPGRRYRQLDVACDPWGICEYGRTVQTALDMAAQSGPHRVPEPAAETVYLAVKRAVKGIRGIETNEQLTRAYRRDATGAARLLGQLYGRAGQMLATALEHERDVSHELDALAEAVAKSRRGMRRTLFTLVRTARRVARPTGLTLSLVGPDGVGKSTLADRLEPATHGLFRRVQRLHLSPSVLPPPSRLLGRPAADGSDPHGRPPSGPIGSMARLAYFSLDTMIGWWPRVAAPRIRSTLVILERGRLDLAVDRQRYRLSLSDRLIRTLGRALPSPELTLVLDAPADVVRGRKLELDTGEIERQLAAWRGHAAERRADAFVLDASQPPDAVTEAALERIDDYMAQRRGDLAYGRLLIDCFGGIARNGKRYAVVTRWGMMRWLLPAGVGSGGPKGTGLYRPARAGHTAMAGALEAAQRGGGRALRHVTLDPTRGLLPPIEDLLGKSGLTLAGALTGEDRPARRAIVSVLESGRPIAFAKVEQGDGAGLEHELAVLTALADCRLEHILVPEVLGFFDWRACRILLLGRVPQNGRADRALSGLEYAALGELTRLGDRLAAVLGTGKGLIPVHGDFAPWNCAPAHERLALWDWEDARLGLPLEDVFHWLTRRLVLFGVGSAESIVARALDPDPQLRAFCAALGAPPDTARAALRASLERDHGAGEAARSTRRRMSLLLAEAQA